MSDMTIIRRSLTGRMFSTITTILTVGIAVGLMLVLLSMRDAGQRAFERGGGNMHMLVSAESDPMTAVLNNLFYARAPRAPITWERYEQLSRAHPFAWAIPVQQGDSYRGYPVLATNEAFFSDFQPQPDRPWEFASGQAFKQNWEVVVGAVAARGAGLKLGDEIHLTHGTPDSRGNIIGAHIHDEYALKVVGILAPTGTSHDRAIFTTLESSWMLHAQDRLEREHAAGHHHDHDHECTHEIATMEDVTDADKLLTGIFFRVITRAGSNVSAAEQVVFNRLRNEPGLTVAKPLEEINGLFRIVSNINQLLVAMAAVVMVSSGVGIMLALYNSMEQRRRQIAVLRVLGCSRPRIFSLVVTESALLGVLGAIAGLGIAHLGAMLVAGALRQTLGLTVEPVLGFDWAIGVIGSAIALASIAGIVPAVMAYRTPVAKNLRPIG